MVGCFDEATAAAYDLHFEEDIDSSMKNSMADLNFDGLLSFTCYTAYGFANNQGINDFSCQFTINDVQLNINLVFNR